MQHNNRVSSILPILFLLSACVTISNGRSIITELRCQCVSTTSKPFAPRLIANVELIPSGPHCPKLEVIVSLHNGVQRCLDPEAKWVKQIMNILIRASRKKQGTSRKLM
ncbi:alveolar macrophage chemotactic factor-like isoform 1-T2 [Rhinophrynus dorsalis]